MIASTLLARLGIASALLATSLPAFAQQTTGSIAGRVIDEQEVGIADTTVEARHIATGFTRTASTDEHGAYRLAALPVGTYEVTAERTGLTRFERSDIIVNIARTTDLEIVLRVAPLTETVTVVAERPVVPVTSSTLGEVVEIARIESLPLNGRQFANLAATVPGVGLGFHSDSTKSTQYSPQISGGNGRNVNYVVDGGDNNDDTVGGLLQLYPLEAIQEFNLMTQRFEAEYGRGGAVLNVVTKSGTNDLAGSWFTLLRDDHLNTRTFSERVNDTGKQDYRRYQFGGSLGGPIVENRAHFFAAFERTQQDTTQVVNTLGLFPSENGAFDVRFRENLLTAKVTATATPAHYLAFRYARDTNSQPTGAGLRAARSSWATSDNTYNSANVNHNWVLRGSMLNELVFQYSDFVNDIPATGAGPHLRFPNGVTAGTSPAAPQGTEQTKWQLRSDFSWTTARLGGLGHQFKTGVNWVHEPHLFIRVGQGTSGIFTMGANDVNGPVTSILVIGGTTDFNIPIETYGLFVQDTWRASPRLTFNLGVRWDYVDGIPFDQSRNPNFQLLQAAGRSGRFVGTALEDFGAETRGDTDNIQPRVGFVYDLDGTGREIVRGGWGTYTDFGYTNANVLTAAIDAVGGSGPVFVANVPAGIRQPDGQFFRVTDPLSTIAAQNLVNPNAPPLAGEVVSPTLEQPFTYQTSLGWARELDPATSVSVDYVRVDGRDLNMRLRPNALVDGRRFLGDLPIQPNSIGFRTAISKGSSRYDALIAAIRRRFSRGLDLNASYTLAKATSDVGTAYDELAQNLVQDVRDPFAPVQQGPSSRIDARHRITVSGIVDAPWGLRVSPMLFYRSALPVHTFEGIDLNRDGNVNDKTERAHRFAGLNDDGTAKVEEAGACKTVNCSRRAPFSQVNLRVSRAFAMGGGVRLEAIGEVFNLFNAKNPSTPLTTQRLSATGTPLASFMQPTAFAGDVQQPEQRIGQVGFRLTF
ncbi:MAG: TonB-dependent receptor [Acidobacteria bacterium]|nr:TonB-dependent receptor [Acidobacteriota bacterium]